MRTNKQIEKDKAITLIEKYILELEDENTSLKEREHCADCDWDGEIVALRAEVAKLCQENANLKDFKTAIEDQHRTIMDEPCDFEKHCSCVPIQRRVIEKLRDANWALEATKEQAIIASKETQTDNAKLKEEVAWWAGEGPKGQT